MSAAASACLQPLITTQGPGHRKGCALAQGASSPVGILDLRSSSRWALEPWYSTQGMSGSQRSNSFFQLLSVLKGPTTR